MFIKPQIQIPKQLPFLEKLCWQREDIKNLTLLEMLKIYERGWHYRGVLGDLSQTETLFVQQLAQYYKSWLGVQMFERELHQIILNVLNQLNANFLLESEAYFGGGTLVSLKHGEYRLSKDIDFLCSSGTGYRWLRQNIAENQYNALFNTQNNLKFPREIKSDQYGVRFAIMVDETLLKFEIIREGRIELGEPDYPTWSPVPCLNEIDSFAEKLLANSDRWNDSSVDSRDLIDLAIQRLKSPIPIEAIKKAETAYPVIEPLKKAISSFQNNPAYRDKCFTALRIINPSKVIDGIDLMAADLSLEKTVRTLSES
ncbi:nucleotidyl transferase AbiEii/AbiGii toxin family protein [Anabaena sp. UHCC 0399]|uniref:nucleotidyl transferase AbiEii/AbiGii toxin family protein n=1 Tax=Anabaena sp. UHCC 0399 TaxID=3110238 RepID=UPI002B1ED6D4|nr:nucleotidyl transferase AbiEii/AbiGii toxin family protein [Anabaena sp. UHCC 0399]MEA5568647.1 nucleotidyl transferase AbiEii/AbiGii toxin family protein [Anabaena sp. UHCC 0399]